MLEFIKYLSGKFFIFGAVAALGGFVIIFLLGGYDHESTKARKHESNAESPTSLGDKKGIASDDLVMTGGGVTKESAKAAAEALLGKNNLPDSLFKNTTEDLAKNISEKIVENNPAGPIAEGGVKKLKTPEVSEIVQTFLEDGAAKFDYASLKPEFSDADLNISADDSVVAIEKYAKEFLALTFQPLDSRAEQASNTADPASALISLISIYKDRLDNFARLEVPQVLAPLHKKHLAILAANKKIFEIMNEYESDPLASVFALNSLNLVREESVDIYRELAQVIIKNQIKL